MSRYTPVVFSGAVLVTLAFAPSARAQSDAIDSRVTFVLGDDNVFAGSADRSPTGDIGPRTDIKSFYDNRDTKDSGQETKTDIALYRRFGGPFTRLETEAGLVIRLDFPVNQRTGLLENLRLTDDGTFLQMSYYLGALPTEGDGAEQVERRAGKAPRVYALFFPFNADRIRLGYSYDITWGGNSIFPKNTSGAPGFKLGWENERAYLFVGGKSHRQRNELTSDLDTVYGLLAGGGIDFTDTLRWEVNGGLFEKGVFAPANKSQPRGLDGEPIAATGVSTQLTYHKGLPIETSVDLRLYRNDPRFPWQSFTPEQHSNEWSYMLSGEATYLVQNLRDAEEPWSSTLQHARAGDLSLRVKKGLSKITADFVYRDLGFILFNVPSFTPYYAFPEISETTAEWFFDVGFDYYFPELRLNPGIIFGYQRPATYLGDGRDDAPAGTQTVIVRREGDLDILPQGQGAYDILSTRLFTRWDVSDGMGVIVEATYTLDKNATRIVRATDGTDTYVRQYDDPSVTNRLALALILQGRF